MSDALGVRFQTLRRLNPLMRVSSELETLRYFIRGIILNKYIKKAAMPYRKKMSCYIDKTLTTTGSYYLVVEFGGGTRKHEAIESFNRLCALVDAIFFGTKHGRARTHGLCGFVAYDAPFHNGNRLHVLLGDYWNGVDPGTVQLLEVFQECAENFLTHEGVSVFDPNSISLKKVDSKTQMMRVFTSGNFPQDSENLSFLVGGRIDVTSCNGAVIPPQC